MPIAIKRFSWMTCMRAAMLALGASMLALGPRALAAPATTTAATTTVAEPLISMPESPALLAHGTSGAQTAGAPQLWLARVAQTKNNGPQAVTQIYHRETRGTEDWAAYAPVQAGAVGLTHDGGKLVVLWADGGFGWTRQAYTTGIALPAQARILAMAGGSTRLWALASVDLSKVTHQEAATAPTTAESDTAALAAPPATAPDAQPSLALFGFDGFRWRVHATWPADWALPAPNAIALVAWDRPAARATTLEAARELPMDHQVFAACIGAGDAIEIVRLRPVVERIARIVPPGPVRDFKLFVADGSVRLWTLGAGGDMQLWDFLDRAPEPIDLRFTGPRLQPGHVAITSAGDQIRLFFLQGEDIYEQSYSPNRLAPVGTPQKLELGQAGAMEQPVNWLYLIALGVLMFILASSMRRQRAQQQQQGGPPALVGGWAVAPLGPRVLAGLIDAVPILVMLVAATRHMVLTGQPPQGQSRWVIFEDAYLRQWFIYSVGAYLLHTTISELLFARTLGKWLLGLRVVDVDGAPPGPLPVVIRNLLRAMDLPPIAFGIVLDAAIMIYSPLRQRLGDLAGSTVVVRRAPTIIEPPEETAPAPPEEPGGGERSS